MKKKRGFTLIEVIITIALLAIIGGAIAVNMVGIYKNQQKKEIERTKSAILAAAEAYVGKNDITGKSCIKTSTLIEENLIKETSIPISYRDSSVEFDSSTGEYKISLTNNKCQTDPSNLEKQKYKITYYDDNGNKLSTVTKNKNEEITISTYAKTGYTLSGWSGTKGGKVIYSVNQKVKVTKNIDLYAVVKKQNYSVKVVYNNGTNTTTKQVAYGNSFTLPTAPTYAGHKFEGWKDEKGISYSASSSLTITGNKTFTAQWKEVITLKVHKGLISSLSIGGTTQSYTNVGDYYVYTVDTQNVTAKTLRLNLTSSYGNNNRLVLDQTANSSKYIANISQRYSSYINIKLALNSSGTTNEVILDPYLKFELYYPESTEIANLKSISVSNCTYAASTNKETINNTSYESTIFKVYNPSSASSTITFNKKANSNVEKTANLSVVSSSSTQYSVKYNFSAALTSSSYEYIGFYYNLTYQLKNWAYGTYGSSTGSKYYGLYDIDVPVGGDARTMGDSFAKVRIFDPENFVANLYHVTHPEESEGSQLWSYTPSIDSCDGLTPETYSFYYNYPIDSSWNGDTYIINVQGFDQNNVNSSHNPYVCNIGLEHYISGYSGGGHDQYTCVQYINDQCVSWKYIGTN